MEQEREAASQVAKDVAGEISGTATTLPDGHPPSREAALRAIREMLTEAAEDALRLGILDCIPLIAAADLAIDDVLLGRR